MSFLGKTINFIPQEKPAITGVTDEEVTSIRDQLADNKDWIVIYEGGESTNVKFLFKASQLLNIK